MAKRKPRAPSSSKGKAWRKTGTTPISETGYTLNVLGFGLPWEPIKHRLALYERAAAHGDIAALIEAIRHCHIQGVAPPEWLVEDSARLLSEIISSVAPPRLREDWPAGDRRFFVWAKAYPQAIRDWMIADEIESLHGVYGLTETEAFDAVALSSRGTPLQVNVAQATNALKRTRQKSRTGGWFKRAPTNWESMEVFPRLNPVRSHSDWWAINQHRQGDRRGEWRERPELLSHLSNADIERKVAEARRRWDKAKFTAVAKKESGRNP